jgi:putative beta-lysine N-acetyltransferase
VIQAQETTGDAVNSLALIEGEAYAARVFFSPLNKRIQVLAYQAQDAYALVKDLEDKALRLGFGKVFLKAPVSDKVRFQNAGMIVEATIDGYFAGRPAAVMSLYLDEARRQCPYAEEQDAILEKIRARPADASVPDLPGGYEMSVAAPGDAVEIAELYRQVFASYPFPITDPGYISSTMSSNVLYRIVRDSNGNLVGAASAETDFKNQNAEMTDFATLPDQRGSGLAQHLLAALEGDMTEKGILNLYTIARARSAGMNRVFYNRNYKWTGTLVNNCHIAGQFEDMHVWCKQLTQPSSSTA